MDAWRHIRGLQQVAVLLALIQSRGREGEREVTARIEVAVASANASMGPLLRMRPSAVFSFERVGVDDVLGSARSAFVLHERRASEQRQLHPLDVEDQS